MFERLTSDARQAVSLAATTAAGDGAEHIEGLHLLRALVESGPTVRAALAALGADPADVVHRAVRLQADPRRAGLSEADVTAIRALGIDVDALLSRLADDLGEQALRARRAGRRSRPAGGAVRFSASSRKALELALRHALRLRSRTLTDAHLLVGLLRADEPVRSLLAADGVTQERLLEWLGRGGDGGAVPVCA